MAVEEHEASGRRVEYFTAGLGAAGTAVAAFEWGWRSGASFALGAGIAWINYRWLRGAVSALARSAVAQAGQETVKTPKSVYIKFLGRFALLLLAVYVILSRSLLPAGGFMAGLFTVVAAVLVEMIYLLARGARQADRA